MVCRRRWFSWFVGAGVVLSGCAGAEPTTAATAAPTTASSTTASSTTASPAPDAADRSADFEAFVRDLPTVDSWAGQRAWLIRVADADAPIVAHELGVYLEEQGYSGGSLDLDVLSDIGRVDGQLLPGFAISLATFGGLFGDRDCPTDPDGEPFVMGVWYALDESDEQLDYLIGSEFSPASVGLSMEDAIAISRSMHDDDFLIYFRPPSDR